MTGKTKCMTTMAKKKRDYLLQSSYIKCAYCITFFEGQTVPHLKMHTINPKAITKSKRAKEQLISQEWKMESLKNN